MSYNSTVKSDRDKVRLLLGDTSNDSAIELITDGESDYFLRLYVDSFNSAAAYCCDAIVAKLARKVNVKIGKVSQELGGLMERYERLAKKLRNQAAGADIIIAPSISQSEVDSFSMDETYTKSIIKRGMHENV